MSRYDALAGSYDAMMTDASYQKRAKWLEKLFRKSRIPVRSVLDLACGTGTIACLLAERGYEVTATDGSEEMLTQAACKAAALEERAPVFLCQSMPRLRLLEQVDPQCLGGVRLDYDGRRVDDTVANRLSSIGMLLKNTVL